MSRRTIALILLMAGAVLWPFRSPAPLVYTPGEGWTYEAVGEVGRWKRQRAKDQLDVAREAFDQKDYKISLKASQYLVRTWPLSDYAHANDIRIIASSRRGPTLIWKWSNT